MDSLYFHFISALDADQAFKWDVFFTSPDNQVLKNENKTRVSDGIYFYAFTFGIVLLIHYTSADAAKL